MPKSNHAVVIKPLAVTVPFSVAEIVVMSVAVPVVTVGGTVIVAKLHV